jgi:glucosamine-6-phosphate deaminase
VNKPKAQSSKNSAAPCAPTTVIPASRVEQFFLAASGRPLQFAPAEKIGVIEVSDFPTLGRLTALRFLEWTIENPEGVVSLPTGKTPEHFIKWTIHFLRNWTSKDVRGQLDDVGIGSGKPPEMRGLRFVQIDEFYPIEPSQHNSFHYYVTKHYIRGFGLDPARAMLIDPTAIGIPPGRSLHSVFPDWKVDLDLRSRQPKGAVESLQQSVIMAVDQFCSEFEEKVRALGGIGFFLGGIGPDGHIGFNPRGSHLHSPTRLTLTNYETEAAAAADLGGIEVSRHKPVITIGLGTITYNPDATVIIFAAGETKARLVADAIQEEKSVRFPASVLQGLPNARFYVTRGAAIRLEERSLDDVLKMESIPEPLLERATIDRAVDLGKRLDELRESDAADDPLLGAILERAGRSLPEAAAWTRERLEAKILAGLETPDGQAILHTGPHHDDVMLGYMPYIMHMVRHASNDNRFAVMTSGFTAVTNEFLAETLAAVVAFLEENAFEDEQKGGVFFPDNQAARDEEVYRYLDGIAARDETMRRRAQSRRMLCNVMNLYEEDNFENVKQRLGESLHYLRTLYPGKKDIEPIQKMKGMQREYEEELIWGYVGTAPGNVTHLRLGFYTGDQFTETPTVERDVAPILELLLDLRPTMVSVALDPEGAGPDTHYKALQALNEALRRYRDRTGKAPCILGYRNVWHRFHPAEANLFVPATLNTMAIMEHSFMNCFGSQRSASFPSHEHDGPFSELAEKLWVSQFQTIQNCLGERFFIENKNPRLRATRGFVFLASMALDEFAGKARSLAQAAEGVGSSGE